MLKIRRSEERGASKIDWLEARHTFSFANYFDPRFERLRSLVVLNEDRIKPLAGFPMHAHRDMEIITFVISGQLRHQDSMGHSEVIRSGEVQYMCAGTGVRHSEHNPSADESTHLIQIWIEPNENSLEPAYEQMKIEEAPVNSSTLSGLKGDAEVRLLVGPQKSLAPIMIHQDAHLLHLRFRPRHQLSFVCLPHRHYWLQVAKGEISVDGEKLKQGDGAQASGAAINLRADIGDCELLLFDLG